MQPLLTKEQAAAYLAIKTPEAAEKLLARLGVPKIDFSIFGGKGVRYRQSDIANALTRIEVNPQTARRQRKPKHPQLDVFDLPVKEAVTLLT